MHLLIISPSFDETTGFGYIAKNIADNISLASTLVLNKEQDVLEKVGEATHVLTIGDLWNYEYLANIKRDFVWIYYCPIEGEDIPSSLYVKSKKIDIDLILRSVDIIVPYNNFGYTELSKIVECNRPILHGINPIYKSNRIYKDEFVVGFVGLNTPRKGIDTLANAWSLIKQQLYSIGVNDPIKLLIHTKQTDFSPDLSIICKEIPRDELIISTESLTPEEMVTLYNYMDLYISMHNAEGFGLPILEAMACGTPVICNGYGGPKDIIDSIADSYVTQSMFSYAEPGAITIDRNLSWKRKYPNVQGMINLIDRDFLKITTNRDLRKQSYNFYKQKIDELYSWKTIGKDWTNLIMYSKKNTKIRVCQL